MYIKFNILSICWDLLFELYDLFLESVEKDD